MDNFKEIHIGKMIAMRIKEDNVDISRICNYFKCSEEEINKMICAESLDSIILLKWSKLLDYDFFRIYSQHLILYSPPGIYKSKNTALPVFRKHIYTKEIISFILEQISLGNMTKTEIVERYKIPKTTLYKWISKYHKK